MPIFQIKNAITGAKLGVYEAAGRAEALDKMAREGRYLDFADLSKQVPWAPGGIEVNEVEQAHPRPLANRNVGGRSKRA